MSSKPTLLYVDDEPINLQLFELNFKKNFNILTADSGFSALEILSKQDTISTVITDMKMPGMNGIEFIREARKHYPELYYFILTGYDITQEIASALEKKLIIKYFRKPFNISEIESVIKTILKK